MHEAAHNMVESCRLSSLEEVQYFFKFSRIAGVIGRRGRAFPPANLRKPLVMYSSCCISEILGSARPIAIWCILSLPSMFWQCSPKAPWYTDTPRITIAYAPLWEKDLNFLTRKNQHNACSRICRSFLSKPLGRPKIIRKQLRPGDRGPIQALQD